jgi:hypothetical protein
MVQARLTNSAIISHVGDDRDLQNIQRLIGHAVVPVLNMLESIKFVNVQPFDMFSMQKEALYILCPVKRTILELVGIVQIHLLYCFL